MMAGINEVRANLERYHPKSPSLQRGQNGQREGGFPGPALCSCDNNALNRKPPLDNYMSGYRIFEMERMPSRSLTVGLETSTSSIR